MGGAGRVGGGSRLAETAYSPIVVQNRRGSAKPTAMSAAWKVDCVGLENTTLFCLLSSGPSWLPMEVGAGGGGGEGEEGWVGEGSSSCETASLKSVRSSSAGEVDSSAEPFVVGLGKLGEVRCSFHIWYPLPRVSAAHARCAI